MSDIEKFMSERKARRPKARADFEGKYRPYAIGMFSADHRETAACPFRHRQSGSKRRTQRFLGSKTMEKAFGPPQFFHRSQFSVQLRCLIWPPGRSFNGTAWCDGSLTERSTSSVSTTA